ncbi:MAG: hypothetical protein E5X49_02140 [Mesorhizobium sp.]|uniref:hypothetical protein n=1 Tax=Mesorhizobium sp. TaxID=1871066 RepID=UPI001203246D|nr:hypothetical protein [Mesorhizobium sp.]TIQ46381.1 MAG: hypothetical protein E5X49_02140 [Mesorhizobium sp.]
MSKKRTHHSLIRLGHVRPDRLYDDVNPLAGILHRADIVTNNSPERVPVKKPEMDVFEARPSIRSMSRSDHAGHLRRRFPR